MPTASKHSSPIRERVAEIIKELRPAVQGDGGDIELVDIDERGVVSVRLHGACIGCPSSGMTLKVGVEQSLKSRIPEVREVICV
jgi:Fe-S cluster biogenesis protein NfuA